VCVGVCEDALSIITRIRMQIFKKKYKSLMIYIHTNDIYTYVY
jgi:hypothetical protein